MGWIRSPDDDVGPNVDFCYAVNSREDALFIEEIDDPDRRIARLCPHLVSSDEDGFLTTDAIAGRRQVDADTWAYMCGPSPMMTAFDVGFRRLVVPAGHIRRERFDAR